MACEPQHGSSFPWYSYSCVRLSILHVGLGIILSSAGVRDGHSMEPATLFLTINVSANASSSLPAPANTPSPTIAQPTTVTQTEIALRRADEAVNAMETWSIAVDVIKRVMDAVSPIAAVCPTSFYLSFTELTPSLQLQPYASLAWSLLSTIPQVRLVALSENTDDSIFFVAGRLCYSRFSVTTTYEHYSKRYATHLNLPKTGMF
jgi:hypothetical protein